MNNRTESKIETLEGRTLFANAGIVADTLVIHGDRGARTALSSPTAPMGRACECNITSVTRRGVIKNFDTSVRQIPRLHRHHRPRRPAR